MKKLFIVDHDKLITSIYRDFFAAKGYIVASSNSPFGAAAGIKSIEPDVLIIDMNIPGFDSDGLLNIIEYRENYKVLLISVDSNAEEMKKLTGNGVVHDYFVKGDPIDMLWHKVNRLLL